MSEKMEAFFTLHRDLVREGPGEAADVAWAAEVAGLAENAEMADIACGAGPDIEALLLAAPKGHVTALDLTPHFVQAVRARWGGEDRVTVLRADMSRVANTHDFIWCAGAAYIIGVDTALKSWRKALRPGGVIAFSDACWFGDKRSARSVANWADYPAMVDEAGLLQRINDAGYEVLAQRRVSDQGWENYYAPLDARIEALRPQADDVLNEVLDEAAEEAACWRAHRDEFGYVLSVVRPV